MRSSLVLYSILGPLFLGPLGYGLWWWRGGESHGLAAMVLAWPVVFAYIIPGIGTNILGLWEFTTELRLGKFRPHHGFVFGAATCVLAWLTLPSQSGAFCWGEVARSAFVLGSVLAVWNWLYDIAAIRAGLIVVHNRPAAEDRGPEAIASDYAPVLFGGFGGCYGALIRLGESWHKSTLGSGTLWLLFFAGQVALLVAPVGLFVGWSYLRHGNSGLVPVTKEPACRKE